MPVTDDNGVYTYLSRLGPRGGFADPNTVFELLNLRLACD